MNVIKEPVPTYIIQEYSSKLNSGFGYKQSAGIKMTHVATGISVTCESEKSIYKNRLKAEKMLTRLVEESTDNISGSEYFADGTHYKHGSFYAMYYSKGVWKESAILTNEKLDRLIGNQ